MARGKVTVTYKESDASRVPDALTEGATWLLGLSARGAVKEVGERLRIRRQGGYSGLDVFLGLLLFLSAGATDGMRPFWEKHRDAIRRVGALAGRRSLPSPASLSRALGGVESELLRSDGTSAWLLAHIGQVDEVMLHPAALSWDARGEGWHVFDLDPSVTTLRHRALPEADDLPEAQRRSQKTGAPGHSGRKRGDLQFRRVTVQHAGSGAWVHAHLSPGNGTGVSDFDQALATVASTCDRLQVPRERVLVRMDGEHGNVPWFASCQAHRLPFLTRLNRPKLYEDPSVLRGLRAATWYQVPSSGCQPVRAAADLGEMLIAPGRNTRRPDGSAYEPVPVRVVASIFPKAGQAKRGAVLDGWQVELFATDLPADRWPAPDVIATYFGRAAEENRFAQEDREIGLDRILSYHLPGQELANLVGLTLWNLRLARGFALDPPPAVAPPQRLRQAIIDDRIPAVWPRDPVLVERLAGLDWTAFLARRPDWRFDLDTGELRCDQGRLLNLTSVRRAEQSSGRTGIIFRRPAGGCEDCSSRARCLNTERSHASKHVELIVPTELGRPLAIRLALIRAPATTAITPIVARPGMLTVQAPLFLPAAARRLAADILSDATFHIEVELPPSRPARPVLVAADDADRQGRRKTWQQNVDRYALPDDARIHVQLAAPKRLRALLGENRRNGRSAEALR